MNRGRSAQSVGRANIFIGSSSEGLEIGRYLQHELEHTGLCEVTRWDQGVFQASEYTMEGLAAAAKKADFAILIATADDTVETRGIMQAAVRDNVIFELGLFIGVLGRERTYIVADQSRRPQLPSDLNGLTWLPYAPRADGNQRAAVNDAVVGIAERVRELGRRSDARSGSANRPPLGQHQMLDIEIERVCAAARAQGWVIKANSDTVLRLQSRAGRKFTFPIGEPTTSRVAFRRFAAELRSNGLRVSQSVRRPVNDAPLPR